MFIGTIIVAGNHACADIHVSSDLSITNVSQVVSFRPLTHTGFLEFYEISDASPRRQLGPTA